MKYPYAKEFKEFYVKETSFGTEGDMSCRRIVIDGSNLARSHGQVPEIKVYTPEFEKRKVFQSYVLEKFLNLPIFSKKYRCIFQNSSIF